MKIFIESKEKYFKIVENWKSFVNNGGHPTSSHMMLYNIIRSKKFDRGFTATKKQIKLDNGANPWQGLDDASWRIHRAATWGSGLEELIKPFGDLSREEIIIAWELIKDDPRLA